MKQILNTNKTIGRKIKHYRTMANLSQQQLSRITNIPQSTLSRIERGTIKHIKIKQLHALCTTFNVNYKEFIYKNMV